MCGGSGGGSKRSSGGGGDTVDGESIRRANQANEKALLASWQGPNPTEKLTLTVNNNEAVLKGDYKRLNSIKKGLFSTGFTYDGGRKGWVTSSKNTEAQSFMKKTVQPTVKIGEIKRPEPTGGNQYSYTEYL